MSTEDLSPFDEFLKKHGGLGRYQYGQIALVLLTAMATGYITFESVFEVPTPLFRCRAPSDTMYTKPPYDVNINDTTFIYKKCEIIDEVANTSTKCSKFIYDDEYIKDSLVIRWDTVCNHAFYKSLITTIYFAGVLIGSFVLGVVADHFGRKKTILTVAILYFLNVIFIASTSTLKVSNNEHTNFIFQYTCYTVGRFNFGTLTMIFVTIFVLGSEIVLPHHRETIGTFCQYFYSIAELLMLMFAYIMKSIPKFQWTTMILVVPTFMYFLLLKESPRWLVAKGRYEEARVILEDLCKKNGYETKLTIEEVEKLGAVPESEEKVEEVPFISTFKRPKMLFLYTNVFFMWFIVSMVFYGLGLSTDKLEGSPYVNFLYSTIAEISGYVIANITVVYIGRRWPMSFSLILSGLACLSPIFFPLEKREHNPGTQKAVIALAMIGKLGASMGFAIVYIITAEMFPTCVRGTVMGIASVWARVGSMLSPQIVLLGDLWWADLPFLVFGGLTLVCGAYSLLLPETRGLSLPTRIQESENRVSFKKIGKITKFWKKHQNYALD
ncbi:hypothetical protein SNEBB_001662 [Seison nebaliae]|nr:hypothetical protein SNEBB_001662 [Seison nebaliae]